MQVVKAIAHFETILVDAIDQNSTTMVLDSISTPAGNLPAGTYGFVIEQESNAKREYVIGTLSGSTLTFTHRDVSPLNAETVDSSADDERQQHRKGASIKLTNFPVLTILARILSGDAELDADTPIVLDAPRTPTSAEELVTKAYVDSVVNGGSVYFETQIVRADAGETIAAAGILLYLKETDGLWYKVNTANTDWYNKQLGISKGSGTAGNAIGGGGVLVSGLDTSISYTAGQIYYGTDVAGVIGTSAGTNELKIGIGDANNKLVFFGNAYRLTDDEKDAIAGTVATPKSSNKFVTELNLTDGGDDQEQTTQDSTTTTGEADATTRRVRIEQSFIPVQKKIAGARLYKAADSGSFTGTVKVSLQADSGGNPDGSDLASYTIPNAEWLLLPVGVVEFLFGTQYDSLTIGGTYWLVVTSSTADNANHPNFGFNSAGGYASGTFKYWNTTDGHVTVTGDDLYFETIKGRASQVPKTGTNGRVPVDLLDVSRKLYVDTTEISIANTGGGTETTLFQKYLPANILETNNVIDFEMYFSALGNQNTDTLTIRVKLGGTTVLTFTFTTASLQVLKGILRGKIIGDGATNAQKSYGEAILTIDGGELTADAAVGFSKAAAHSSGTSAVDDTARKLFQITADYLNAAGADSDLTAEAVIVKLIR